jgi:hypothetical protein
MGCRRGGAAQPRRVDLPPGDVFSTIRLQRRHSREPGSRHARDPAAGRACSRVRRRPEWWEPSSDAYAAITVRGYGADGVTVPTGPSWRFDHEPEAKTAGAWARRPAIAIPAVTIPAIKVRARRVGNAVMPLRYATEAVAVRSESRGGAGFSK